MGNEKEKRLKILDTLTDFLGRSEGQTVEEIKEELRDEGVDVDAALARLKNFQQNISMKARRSVLDAAREKRLESEKKGHTFIGRFKDWPYEQIKERAMELMELAGPDFVCEYRDLEKMDKEQLIAMLEDLELTWQRGLEKNGDEE